MAVFWKATAGGLLLTLGLALLGQGAEGQGNGRGRKEVSGGDTFYLGQDRDVWRPLVHTTVNLTEINNIKSSFQLRTYDPEGAIFYGDTKNGRDWFVLALKEGIPLMQVSRQDIAVNVAGGPKLNDGKWHKLELSNLGDFVVLEVDGSKELVLGVHAKALEEVISGELRLALGGILIDKEQMFVQFESHMDGCVRGGSWLNLSVPWEAEVDELWPCYQNIQPGSYFPGTGFAIFNTSDFAVEEHGMKIELWADFHQMDGTVLSVRAPGQGPMFSLAANNNTKTLTLTFRDDQVTLTETPQRVVITMHADSLHVLLEGDESKTRRKSISTVTRPGDFTTWRDSRMAIGGLLGDEDDDSVSQLLTGCLKKIQVQGKDLDLDVAVKHTSLSSHSCPA